MKMSKEGLKFLIEREGFKNKAYQDTKKLWTIGVGHLINIITEKELLNKVLTNKEVEELFAKDISVYESCVTRAIAPVQLKQSEFDACVSLCFNIGQRGFEYSTVVKKIKAGMFNEVGTAMAMWNKPPEIIGRRNKEIHLFETGEYK